MTTNPPAAGPQSEAQDGGAAFPQDELERINGLYVGQLSSDEMRLFENAVEANLARRSYEGGAGLMGVAIVRLSARGETK